MTEATDARERMFGNDALLEALSEDFGTGEDACRGACRTVKEKIDRFVGEAPQFDDMTMLCLYYAGK